LTTRLRDPGLARPAARPSAWRWLEAAAWAGAGLVLFTFFLRVSFSGRIDSDGANSVLQGWDLIHGHLPLHGWHLGDATFYAFELPLIGVAQLAGGLGDTATHVASALVYLVVAGCAAVLAVTGSRGAARAARCAVVVAVLAAPLLYAPNVWLLLEEPDHLGTSMFILAAFLLADLAPNRRFAPPLLLVILCAGQFSDLTVRYVAVPAVVIVCAYRMLAARRLRSADLAFAVAAVVSVPLDALLGALVTHLGGFAVKAPLARLSPPRLWHRHASVTWLDIRVLFGAISGPQVKLGSLGTAFAWVCLLAALAGLVKVVLTWRTATRGEQLLAVAIVANVGAYVISVMPLPVIGSHEVIATLPCGAVLAARALVPARIRDPLPAFAAVAAAGLIALVPLGTAATRPPLRPATAALSAWLAAHHLTYGIGGYWDASVVTLQSGGSVRIRAVDLHKNVNKPGWTINIPNWETNALWYETKRQDATFAIADLHGRYPATAFQQVFGKPRAGYRVGGYIILVYRHNLLGHLRPMPKQLQALGAVAVARTTPESSNPRP
jgi:hypothetical protein